MDAPKWEPREVFTPHVFDSGWFITGEMWPDQMGFVNLRNPLGEINRGSGFRGEDKALELLIRYINEYENEIKENANAQ
jgi:hypothetical protein